MALAACGAPVGGSARESKIAPGKRNGIAAGNADTTLPGSHSGEHAVGAGGYRAAAENETKTDRDGIRTGRYRPGIFGTARRTATMVARR